MSNAEAIYEAVRAGEPRAVSYYQNLKVRIADGERAQLCLNAIRAVHERRKENTMRPYFGADYPAGSYLTPNGKVLTPQAIAQLVGMFRSATFSSNSRDVQFASPEVVHVIPAGLQAMAQKFAAPATATKPAVSASKVIASVVSEANNPGFAAMKASIDAAYAKKQADLARARAAAALSPAPTNTAAQREALRRSALGVR